MAANFSSAEDICEGENCEAITDVTYYVKEKKKLCDNCASTGGCIGKARKGGTNLYCVKHDEEIKLYCKKHGVALCYSCAHIDHHDQCCVRQDIEGAIMESKASLTTLKEKAKDKLKLCQVYGDQIQQCRKDTDTHLQALRIEVDSVINEAIQTDKGIEKEDAAKINQEFNEKNKQLREKIRKNDEEKMKRLELNRTNAEKRREPIDNKQHSLQTDIQNIAKEKEKKIVELEKTWQDNTKTTRNTIKTLDTVLEDDNNVAKDGHHVKTSVSDELKKPLSLNEGEVKQITGTISGVRFVKGAGREKYDGRIDRFDGEWKLIDTINVKDKITFPVIVGCIDECNVIISDRLKGSHVYTYILDMTTKHSQRVLTGSNTSNVTSCVLLNEGEVLCGRYSKGCTRGSLAGCISVHDRRLKLIDYVTIARNTTDDFTGVDVAVDQDGMIIAAEWGQSKIYAINPADRKIMKPITCRENIMLRGVLSSSHIIAQPYPRDNRLFIIDRQGAHRPEILHSGVILNACIDPMIDDLYVVTSDDEYKTCVIDQVMSGGGEKKRRVVSFPLPTRLHDRKGHLVSSQVMMTSSGKLIASDGDKILVFKKLLIEPIN
ncbi:uncharacterized protein LOC105444448 [Strongylocentrotus purpuratus]|uniref:B box-type domain-containing protein n=1 Tax=Strongylocentrotus purpuratus TaxID=7668 RepID=A0A7M7PBW5_STRPU|nr:uncharacterized protein LOC105444448 [Strongylocentrotus purpuratus]